MSLLDVASDDFAEFVCSTDDFAEPFVYTPAGGATAITLTGPAQVKESRFEERNGWLIRFDRVLFGAPSSLWSPSLGARIVWDSRTWDFSSCKHERSGGRTSAYFERQVDEVVGAVGASPV